MKKWYHTLTNVHDGAKFLKIKQDFYARQTSLGLVCPWNFYPWGFDPFRTQWKGPYDPKINQMVYFHTFFPKCIYRLPKPKYFSRIRDTTSKWSIFLSLRFYIIQARSKSCTVHKYICGNKIIQKNEKNLPTK